MEGECPWVAGEEGLEGREEETFPATISSKGARREEGSEGLVIERGPFGFHEGSGVEEVRDALCGCELADVEEGAGPVLGSAGGAVRAHYISRRKVEVGLQAEENLVLELCFVPIGTTESEVFILIDFLLADCIDANRSKRRKFREFARKVSSGEEVAGELG